MTDMTTIEQKLANIERLLAMSSKEVFNSKDAAMFLGISRDRLYHLTQEKRIPYYKQGNTNFFKKKELESWMTAQRVPTDQEVRSMAATRITLNNK